MSSRERWTVYPLLLLAIGLAMRAAPPSEADLALDVLSAAQVRCREIVVETDDGTVLLHMGRVVDAGGGRIEIKNADGVETIAIGTRPGTRAGRIEFYDESGSVVSIITGEMASGQKSEGKEQP